MKKSVRNVIIFLIVAASALGAILFLRSAGLGLGDLFAVRERLLDYARDYTAFSALIYVTAYVVVVAVSIPGATVLTLLGGFLFGPLLGLLLVNVGATTGAFLVFLIARFLLRDALMEKYGAPLAKLNKELETNGANYLLTLRFVPVFPFFLINLLAGLTPVRSFTYLWTTSLGIIPGSLVYTLLGASGAELGSGDVSGDGGLPRGLPSELVLGLVLLGVVSLLPVLINKFRKKKA
jgi:uncharacterized membrane protein YdjX (TVP38/TMEM64 family)